MKKVLKLVGINVCVISLTVCIVLIISTIAETSINAMGSTPETKYENVVKDKEENIVIAPDFSAIDSNGNVHQLSDYKGKIVVLEWKNHKCPFVKKYYSQGNMQAIQKELTNEGVIWLSIISSAKNKQGNVTPEECNLIINEEESNATAVLLDDTGEVGRLYNAKTTPHMYVINATGELVYEGAIDSIRSADPADINSATNYVIQAVNELQKNVSITVAKTQPYGCSIKY